MPNTEFCLWQASPPWGGAFTFAHSDYLPTKRWAALMRKRAFPRSMLSSDHLAFQSTMVAIMPV
jgi:hypothetical protein